MILPVHWTIKKSKNIIISILEKGWSFICKFSSPEDALCKVLLKLAKHFWGRIFLNFMYHPYFLELSMCFHYVANMYPWKRASCANDWLKSDLWFLKRSFKSCPCIFTTLLFSPLDKRCGPLQKFELAFPKNALCQVWLNTTPFKTCSGDFFS